MELRTLKAPEILEYAKKSNLGIGSEMLSDDVLKKTGKQLIEMDDIYIKTLDFENPLISNVLYWRLEEYKWGEWVTCLQWEILLEYTIPIMSKVLCFNVLVPGFFYKGEILYRILLYDGYVWNKHPEWKLYFINLLNNIFIKFSNDKLKEELEESMYERLKKLYNQYSP